jgi:hypothetical protein
MDIRLQKEFFDKLRGIEKNYIPMSNFRRGLKFWGWGEHPLVYLSLSVFY